MFWEKKNCRVLSLTRVNVITNDSHACHRIKRSDRVIAKFQRRKQKNHIMYKRKNLSNKSQVLANLITEYDAMLTTLSVSLKFNGQQYLTENF